MHLRIKFDKYLWLYTIKYLAGVILGVLLGTIRFIPETILEKLLGIGLIILVLVIVTVLCRFIFRIDRTLQSLLLMHGTFWYILAVLAFWSLFLAL